MKKIIITIVAFFISIINVSAMSISLSSVSEINPNGEFTVTINVSNASDFYGLTAPINYDTSKLSIVSTNGLNSFNAFLGNNIVIDNFNGKSGNYSIASIVFKAKSSFIVGESTTISIGSADVVDNNSSTVSGASTTLKVVPVKSSDNNLTSLTVDSGTLNFSPETTSYKVYVTNYTKEITISGELSDSLAKVSGLGTISLNVYSNTINIVVTAENGSTKTYTITVYRADEDGNFLHLSSDNKLKDLSIEGYDFIFSNDISIYTFLKYNIEKENINAVANSASATVDIIEPDNYITGNNIVQIIVTAANGDEKIFTINFVILDEQFIEDEEEIEELDNIIVLAGNSKNDNNFRIFLIIMLSLIVICIPIGLIYLAKRDLFPFKKKKKTNKSRIMKLDF